MNTSSGTTSDRYARSSLLHAAACKVLPGGVNSPVRAYKAVGRSPIVIREGKGCRVTDVDGNSYIDYVGSYGPLIVGHAHEAVVAAVLKTASHGMSFGMPTELETQLAEAVVSAVSSIEVVRFVNSGTEATMSAIRLARGATGRSKIIKCIGGYHGHADGLLVQAGSGATTLGVPSSPGVPAAIAAETLLLGYNDVAGAERLFAEHGRDIACLMIEPIAGNMGCVPPAEGYLAKLRELCTASGAILLFDEVMTGFRVAYGGAQSIYNVKPDLTCLGKVIGGGMPCAAYGGSRALMEQMAPVGPIYQAGTLSGNPVAMAAGLATLEILRGPGVYKQLEDASAKLADGLARAARSIGVPLQINRVGSMLTPFFTSKPVKNYDEATASDTKRFASFFGAMLDHGVTLPPSQYEAWFVSLAHDDEAITQTIVAAERSLSRAASAD
ncbi:MAG: glutamate-1-semialdehyde 2,1-aminomutase [Planctomycetes bacterium]|nr:glutamate-1-semialdehyde 2,1-aminomutase [Planctomycetota bacterium]